MAPTLVFAAVSAGSALLGAVVGALGAMHRADRRFRVSEECDRRHEAERDAVAGLRQTVVGLGDRVECLAVQVAGVDRSVAVLGERLSGAFAHWDEVKERLNALVTAGCPYGNKAKGAC